MDFKIRSDKDLVKFKKELKLELDSKQGCLGKYSRGMACGANCEIDLLATVVKHIKDKKRLIVNSSPIDADELRRQLWHNNDGTIIVVNPPRWGKKSDDLYSILTAAGRTDKIQCPSIGKYAIYDPDNYYGDRFNKKLLKRFNERIANKKNPKLYYPNRFYFNGLLIFVDECNLLLHNKGYSIIEAYVYPEYANAHGLKVV